MESIWKQQIQLPKRSVLKEDIHIKNVVIGAGMAGLLTAYMLQERGQEVAVLEANTVLQGKQDIPQRKLHHNII